MDDLPSPKVAAYWELDARLGWRPTPLLEFSIVGQNLFHDGHIEFIPSAPRHVTSSAAVCENIMPLLKGRKVVMPVKVTLFIFAFRTIF